MSTTSNMVAPPNVTVGISGPRKTLKVLRVVAVSHALVAIILPVFAGLYLSGDASLWLHGRGADVTVSLGLIQLIAAIVYVWKGRGQTWALYGALGIFLLEQVQMPMGIEGIVAVHVPLGVAIIVLQVLLTVELCRPKAAVARPRAITTSPDDASSSATRD